MDLGVLSVSFARLTSADLARRVNRYGFTSVQLDLAHLADYDYRAGVLSTGLANKLAEQFERQQVKIPALACYRNLIHPDKAERSTALKELKEHLRYARDFGASTVTTETGTANRESPWEHHPDNQSNKNWLLLRESVLELAEEAERWGVFVGLEGYTNNVINTPERMEQLLEEVSASNVGIVMDPCNYIDQTNKHRQDEVIQDAFNRLGERILIAHAKDFNYANVDHVQPAAGTGELNYVLYLKLLQQAKPNVGLFLEHLDESQMLAAIAYVRQSRE